jgi:hypothetical protein
MNVWEEKIDSNNSLFRRRAVSRTKKKKKKKKEPQTLTSMRKVELVQIWTFLGVSAGFNSDRLMAL